MVITVFRTPTVPHLLSAEELSAIRYCSDNAPPGPWHACGDHLDDSIGVTFAIPAGAFETRAHDTFCSSVVFMAQARSYVPALLAHVAALEAEIAEMRQALAGTSEAPPNRRRLMPTCQRCLRRHRDWSTLARCYFRICDVRGDGAFAVLSCDGRSGRPVTLWPTLAEAQRALQAINGSGCGRCCRRDHRLVDLGGEWPRRLDDGAD